MRSHALRAVLPTAVAAIALLSSVPRPASALDCGEPPLAGCGCEEGTTLSCGSDVGVCAAGVEVCVDGYLTPCGGGEIGPLSYDEDEGEAGLCNGLDDNCDGRFDEGCACEPGISRACGSDEGTCDSGTQACSAGTWDACVGGIDRQPELCDGLDNDCDGRTDEDSCGGRGTCDGEAAACDCDAGWVFAAGTCLVVDADADGVPDLDDNCVGLANPDQGDADADGVGDGCDVCPSRVDHFQLDRDVDGVGDACEVEGELQRAADEVADAQLAVRPLAPGAVAGKLRSASKAIGKASGKQDRRRPCRSLKSIDAAARKLAKAVATVEAKTCAAGQSRGCIAPADAQEVLSELAAAGAAAADAREGLSAEIDATVYVSSSCGGTKKCFSHTACTFEDALSQAASLADPVLLLTRSDHVLASTIDAAVVVRAQKPGKVRIVAADTAAPTLQIAAGSDVVVLDGPSIDANDDGRALLVTSGRVSLDGVAIGGSATADGADAVVAVTGAALEIPAGFSPADPVVADGGCYTIATPAFCEGARGYIADHGASLSLYATRLVSAPARSADGPALNVANGAVVRAHNVVIGQVQGIGVCVSGASTLALVGSTIDRVDVDDDGNFGWGMHVGSGAKARLMASTISTVGSVGVLAQDAGTRLSLDWDSAVREVYQTANLSYALGVVAQHGARLLVDRASIEEVDGGGILLSSGVIATISDATIRGNKAFGIAVAGTMTSATDASDAVAITGSYVGFTKSRKSAGLGLGIFVSNDEIGPSRVRIEDSRIEHNRVAGLYVRGDGGELDASASRFSYNEPEALGNGVFSGGNAVLAVDVCSGLALRENRFDEHTGAGVLLHGSNATAADNRFMGTNHSGAGHAVQQGCDASVPSHGPPCGGAYTAFDCEGAGTYTPWCHLCPEYDHVFQDVTENDLCLELVEASVEQ